MLNYILKPIKHESFYKKYAEKRYLKVRHPLALLLIPILSMFICVVKCMGARGGSPALA